MSQSPRLSEKKPSQPRQSLSAPTLLFVTALDTTWRIFVPILAGVFAGIGLDHTFHSTPLATIVGLIIGTIITVKLITQQLVNVRKPLK